MTRQAPLWVRDIMVNRAERYAAMSREWRRQGNEQQREYFAGAAEALRALEAEFQGRKGWDIDK